MYNRSLVRAFILFACILPFPDSGLPAPATKIARVAELRHADPAAFGLSGVFFPITSRILVAFPRRLVIFDTQGRILRSWEHGCKNGLENTRISRNERWVAGTCFFSGDIRLWDLPADNPGPRIFKARFKTRFQALSFISGALIHAPLKNMYRVEKQTPVGAQVIKILLPGLKVGRLPNMGRVINGLDVSPNGKRILVFGSGGIRLLDADGRLVRKPIASPPGTARDARYEFAGFSRDGNRILLLRQNGIEQLDLLGKRSGGARLRKIRKVTISPDARFAFSSEDDLYLKPRLADLRHGRLKTWPLMKNQSIEGVHFTPDSRHILLVYSFIKNQRHTKTRMTIFDLGGRPRLELQGDFTPDQHVRFSPDGRYLFVGGDERDEFQFHAALYDLQGRPGLRMGKARHYLPDGSRAMVTAANALNVRVGPGLNYKRLGALRRGRVVRISDSSDYPATIKGITAYWYRIHSRRLKGWVFGGYLRMRE